MLVVYIEFTGRNPPTDNNGVVFRCQHVPLLSHLCSNRRELPVLLLLLSSSLLLLMVKKVMLLLLLFFGVVVVRLVVILIIIVYYCY